MSARKRRRAPHRATSRLTVRDALDEALASMLGRPSRTVSTVLGTVLGVAAFVSTLGITATAAAQISSRFDVYQATEVRVRDTGTSTLHEPTFPGDTDARLERLAGVRSGGVLFAARDSTVVEAASVRALDEPLPPQLRVLASSPGGVAATRPELATGRLFDRFHAEAGARVALLGATAARRLNITRVDNQPAVFVEGVPFTVIGIIEHVAREASLLEAVVVPDTTARSVLRTRTYQAWVLVDVMPGAAQQVGRQVALALRPHDPDRLEVLVPPDPESLRRGVEQETSALFLLLAGVGLLVGGVGIANTASLAVLERAGEFGLRRALGARPVHIAAQVLTEAAALGTLGGVIGAGAGVLLTAGVAAARTWGAVLDPSLVLLAPLVGTTTGLLAGLAPARRATRISPVEALRR